MTAVSTPASSTPDASPANTPAIIPEIPSFAGTKHKIDWGDGNAQELSYEELVSDYKMSKKEAARALQLQQQLDPAMAFLSSLQGGELEHLSQLVPEEKLLDYAEKVLRQKLEWEEKSPAERELIQERKRLDKEKKEYEDWKKQKVAEQYKVVEQQALGQVQKDIVEAINELGLGSKPSPRLVRRVAEQYLAQLQSEKSPDVRRASKYEWENIQKELSEFQMMALQKDPEKFVESLPKDILRAIRDYEIKKSNPFNRGASAFEESNTSTTSKKSNKVVDFDALENIYNPPKKKRAK